MVLSLRRHGACRMLRWEVPTQRYRCGAIVASAEPRLWLRLWNRLARRWIAADSGCDATLQAESPQPPKSDCSPSSGP